MTRTNTPYDPGDPKHATRQKSTTLRRMESTSTSGIDLPVTTIGTAPLRLQRATVEDDDEK